MPLRIGLTREDAQYRIHSGTDCRIFAFCASAQLLIEFGIESPSSFSLSFSRRGGMAVMAGALELGNESATCMP